MTLFAVWRGSNRGKVYRDKDLFHVLCRSQKLWAADFNTSERYIDQYADLIPR